jgi:hypothetical protein
MAADGAGAGEGIAAGAAAAPIVPPQSVQKRISIGCMLPQRPQARERGSAAAGAGLIRVPHC